MDTTERQVIDELFDKLRQVEQQTGQRDRQAEAHIRNLLARQPAAPYYMAQTILVQEQALATATARIEEMKREREARSTGGGFLGGLFGGGGAPAAGRRSDAISGDPRVAAYTPAGRTGGHYQTGTPGFLAGAMQTAVGVAGGMMLASALGSMFGAGDAAAAEPGSDDPDAGQSDLPEDTSFGADDGDFGSFDDF